MAFFLLLFGCGDAPALPVVEMSAPKDAGASVALEAAVVDPCSTQSGVLADFPAQFSGVQGGCSWLYGYTTVEHAFKLLPSFDAKSKWWSHPSAPFLLIWGGGMHPFTNAASTLRWSSTFAGKVRVLGSVKLTDPGQAIGGNGIVFRIRNTTTDVLAQGLSCTPNVPFAFDVTIDIEDGGSIDFMVEAKDGNTAYDTTALDVRIQRAD